MFFTQINQMMNRGVDITLVIRKKEGQLTVSALPKSNGLKDEAQNHIVPFVVTGTPQELDMGFIGAIYRPMQKATGLLTNMSSFEQQAEKAAANSKALKEQKDKEAKEARDKKEKFDRHMRSAADLEAEKKYSEALTSLQQARTFATSGDLKSVDEKVKAIKIRMGQGSLFDMEAAQPQQPVQPAWVNTGQPIMPQQPVIQQQPVSGQAQQQPVNTYAGQNGQPGIQWQPAYGNGQTVYQQPVYQQPQGGQPYYGQAATDANHDLEPQLITNDPSAHREGEYDQYPDFPGYTDNRMYNQQNS